MVICNFIPIFSNLLLVAFIITTSTAAATTTKKLPIALDN